MKNKSASRLGMVESSVRTLCAGDIKVRIDPGTATISDIIVRGHSLLTGRQGYVSLEDRTTGKFYFKPEQATAAEILKDDSLVFRQTDASAGLTMTQRFSPGKNGVEWSVEVNTERPDIREIHLHFVLPVFGPDSHGFTAHAKCPLVPGDGIDHMMVVYGPNMWNEESFHCSVLPMVSSYDPKTDAGLVVVQPVDVAKPRMEYFFVREQPDILLVVRWTHLRLVRNKAVVAKMLLIPIRGCWRDALRCVHDLYPDYFRVHQQSVFSHEGPMICAELVPESDLDKLVKEQDLNWQEIHAAVFEYYGDYASQKDAWPDWAALGALKAFDLERLSRIGFRDMHSAIANRKETLITRQKVNHYIKTLHQKGVAAYLYTNPVILDLDHIGDFPDDLAKSAEGTPMFQDYYRNAPMYPAAGTAWGKYLDAMTERALELFPEMDGFFLDELHWNQFDFAHDDGVSARGDKPVAMIGFAVQDAARRICAAAHRRGKAVWANGPNTLEVVRYVDGFMAESSWEWLGTVLYLGLEKPVVLLMPGGWSLTIIKDALNAALFAGAQPSVIKMSEYDTECESLLRRYQVLFKILRGRRWILHPHAVTTEPAALRTNCFILPDNDFAVTLSRFSRSDHDLMSADGYVLGKDKVAPVMEDPTWIRLRWPGIEDVRSAKLFSTTGPKKPLSLKIHRESGGISVSVPKIGAAVIRLGI